VQHASDAFVAEWKCDQVRAALAAQGLDAPIAALHVSPPGSRRRAVLAGRRTKAGQIVGFHGRGSGTLTEIPDCRLLRPELMAALPALGAVVTLAASRKSELALALTLTETGLDLEIAGAKPLDPRRVPQILHALGPEFARLTWNGEVMAEPRVPLVRLGSALVPLPPGAFLQATAEGEAALVAAICAAVGPARQVADLFAGLGTFALPLAETAAVHAVEAEAPMLAALDRGWRDTPGLRRIVTERRDLFRRPLDAAELKPFDAVVLDPPRAGAEAQIAELAGATVPVIAYASCNPATFARDARILAAAGYRLDWIEVIDQFRWSPHVELAARFVAGDMRPA
jgi:23S rRNA (uracil1939-C5)-methyltransferase